MSAYTEPMKPALPARIDASTMVLRSQRSTARHAVDWVLTLLAWLVFLYLFAKGIWAVGTNQVHGLDMPFLSRALPSVDTLAIYGLAMLVQACLLILWAVYNWSRFRGKTRRAAAVSLTEQKLSRSYGVDSSMLLTLQKNPVSVIHHTPDGGISAISAPLRAV
jgi:biofilm PGA synthesis protein PgaD